jgi:hypothetical protein
MECMTGDNSTSEGDDLIDGTPVAALRPPTATCPGFVFDALSAERRRILCRVLDEGHTGDLDDLARDIAAVEQAGTDQGVTDAVLEAVYTSLYHQHVPKLASCGVVHFDRDTMTVEPGERFTTVDAALRAVEGTLGSAARIEGIDG